MVQPGERALQVLQAGDLTADRIGDRIRWNPMSKITAPVRRPIRVREPDLADLVQTEDGGGP